MKEDCARVFSPGLDRRAFSVALAGFQKLWYAYSLAHVTPRMNDIIDAPAVGDHALRVSPGGTASGPARHRFFDVLVDDGHLIESTDCRDIAEPSFRHPDSDSLIFIDLGIQVVVATIIDLNTAILRGAEVVEVEVRLKRRLSPTHHHSGKR